MCQTLITRVTEPFDWWKLTFKTIGHKSTSSKNHKKLINHARWKTTAKKEDGTEERVKERKKMRKRESERAGKNV